MARFERVETAGRLWCQRGRAYCISSFSRCCRRCCRFPACCAVLPAARRAFCAPIASSRSFFRIATSFRSFWCSSRAFRTSGLSGTFTIFFSVVICCAANYTSCYTTTCIYSTRRRGVRELPTVPDRGHAPDQRLCGDGEGGAGGWGVREHRHERRHERVERARRTAGVRTDCK